MANAVGNFSCTAFKKKVLKSLRDSNAGANMPKLARYTNGAPSTAGTTNLITRAQTRSTEQGILRSVNSHQSFVSLMSCLNEVRGSTMMTA